MARSVAGLVPGDRPRCARSWPRRALGGGEGALSRGTWSLTSRSRRSTSSLPILLAPTRRPSTATRTSPGRSPSSFPGTARRVTLPSSRRLAADRRSSPISSPDEMPRMMGAVPRNGCRHSRTSGLLVRRPLQGRAKGPERLGGMPELFSGCASCFHGRAWRRPLLAVTVLLPMPAGASASFRRASPEAAVDSTVRAHHGPRVLGWGVTGDSPWSSTGRTCSLPTAFLSSS